MRPGVTPIVLCLLGLTGPVRAAQGPTSEIPDPFRAFQHVVGAWKGTGVPAANRIRGWSERHVWAWRFAQGSPVGLAVTMEGDKILARAQLSFDPATKRYKVVASDPAGQPAVFTGAADATGRSFVLERTDVPKSGKERLTIRLNSNQIRYTIWLDRQPPGAPQYDRVIEVNMGKEGEAFAAGGSAENLPRCILTGGAATMTVTYEGKSYPICCTGCRDEFLENPAKYVQKALLRAQASNKPKVTTASALRKDDGAFEGLGDEPAAKPAKPKATPKRSAERPASPPPAHEPAPDASKPDSLPPAAEADRSSKDDAAHHAATLLRSAQALEKLGKSSAALNYYRQLVARYANTPQAKTAAARIKALSKPRP